MPATILGLICGYCIIEKSPYGIYNRKWCRYYMFKICVLF
jgi:hypothetical protein